MTACKMKDIHYVRYRKKTEKANKILVCIVVMEMYCDDGNVLWWWKCIVIMEMHCDDINVLWWWKCIVINLGYLLSSIVNDSVGEVLYLLRKNPTSTKST